MLVKIKVNGKLIQDDVQPQTLLLDWLRDHGCYSVKRGCDWRISFVVTRMRLPWESILRP